MTKIRKSKKGYILEYNPEHKRADKRGYVMQHILVFERCTGIQVPINCVIHHMNSDKSDNRIENLCMMSFGAHTSMHNRLRRQSDEAKSKISIKTKERLKDKTNHPKYKEIDSSKMIELRNNGNTVKEICEIMGICKCTYYKKMEEFKNEHNNI